MHGVTHCRNVPAALQGPRAPALSLRMLALKRYAAMRLKLEASVEERTLELRQKSLELEPQATHDKLTGSPADIGSGRRELRRDR